MNGIADGDGIGCKGLRCDESWRTQSQAEARDCEEHSRDRCEMSERQ